MNTHEIPTVSDGKSGWQAVLFDGGTFRTIAYAYANDAVTAAALVDAALGQEPRYAETRAAWLAAGRPVHKMLPKE